MKKGTLKWIFIGLGAVLAVLVLFLLVLDAYGNKQRKVRSTRFGYEIAYDESRYEFETLRLDERPTYMERIFLSGSPYSNFITVSGIDAESDLEEILTTFQSDGSYKFDDKADVTFGSGAYHARKVSYTDESGDAPVQVDYYFLKDRGLLISAAYDKEHAKEIAEMVDSITFE